MKTNNRRDKYEYFPIMMEPFRQRIVALIAKYIKFIFTFVHLTESSRPFCLKHSRHKESVFPLNASNDTLIVFHPHAN